MKTIIAKSKMTNMPTHCFDCDFCYDCIGCMCDSTIKISTDDRPEKCPLEWVLVSKGGRVDEYELYNK